MADPAAKPLRMKSVAGGLLVQERDAGRVDARDCRVVTRRAPSEREMADLALRLPRRQAREVERHRLRARTARRSASAPGR